MAIKDKIKNFAKKAVGHPTNDPPIVSSSEWLHRVKRRVDPVGYAYHLFPIFQWLPRYNGGWLVRDLIAGLTVGMILVPQAMAYAKVATLDPEYGLYSAIVGVFTYTIFSTSKDVSVGPVTVVSLEVANIIKSVQESSLGHTYEPHVIATCVAFMCGIVIFGIGILRLGWIVEFISSPAVAGFATGTALNIVTTQIPSLLGISKRFDTRESIYLVLINTLKNLKYTKEDAAFGFFGLATLYVVRDSLTAASKRWPQYQRAIFFAQSLRSALVLVFLTLGSWLYCRGKGGPDESSYPIAILKTVPRGFGPVSAPTLDSDLIGAIAHKVPVATIIVFLEHVAVAKSFGRINNYKVDPSQELVGLGAQNVVSTFFGAYPSTGAFSRSALNSKSGVRTPLGGFISGIVVIVALYGLTDAFYWIPSAGLSAIIIHAVADLVASFKVTYHFWRLSPFEFFIFIGAIFATVFSSIETGIYFSMAASLALLLIRVARPRSHWVGVTKVHLETTGDTSVPSQQTARTVFVPFSGYHSNDTNPSLKVRHVAPGVFIYRPDESITYPNAYRLTIEVVDHIKEHTRCGADNANVSPSDRPWNEPGPTIWSRFRKSDTDAELALAEEETNTRKPFVKAVIFDLGVSSHVDVTGMEALKDAKAKCEHWRNGPVEFHFANIQSPWIRRVLVSGGFGRGQPSFSPPREMGPLHDHSPSISEYGVILRNGSDYDHNFEKKAPLDDEEAQVRQIEEVGTDMLSPISPSSNSREESYGTLVSTTTPFFHFDLTAAVRAATGKIEI